MTLTEYNQKIAAQAALLAEKVGKKELRRNTDPVDMTKFVQKEAEPDHLVKKEKKDKKKVAGARQGEKPLDLKDVFAVRGTSPRGRTGGRGNFPRDDRPRDDKHRDDRPRDDRPRDDKHRDDRPRDDKHRDDRPRDDRPRDDKHRDDRPRDDKHRDDRPRDDRPRDDKPRDDKPRDDKPRDGGSPGSNRGRGQKIQSKSFKQFPELVAPAPSKQSVK